MGVRITKAQFKKLAKGSAAEINGMVNVLKALETGIRQKNGWGLARKTEYNGRLYDSGLEARHAMKLDVLLKAGKIEKIECQVLFYLEVNSKRVSTYRPDFLITWPDGTQEIHECKGFAPKSWPMRKKLFEALYPEIPITVIKKA